MEESGLSMQDRAQLAMLKQADIEQRRQVAHLFISRMIS